MSDSSLLNIREEYRQMEYYDPMLYLSTPEIPTTMGMLAVMTEPVDGEILRVSVEELRRRFPWFYVRVEAKGNDLVPVPNPRPVTVRNSWEPVPLHSEEANGHLMAFKYEGDRVALEISHAVTDGAGLLPYFKSVLYVYLCRKTGLRFDPSGFRLPGDAIPATESGNPFAGWDVDGIERPFYRKPAVPDFYRICEYFHSSRREWQLFCLKLPEESVMHFCRDQDGSPNVLFSVLLARAVRRMDPDSEKTVTAAVAVDHKAQLGNFDNYRMHVSMATVDFPRNRAGEDIGRMCTVARGQLMLQAQPENSLFMMKMKKASFERMKPLPLSAKIAMGKQVIGVQQATVGVSYTRSRSFGPLDPYIRELYVLAEPWQTDVMCEVSCIHHSFFLAFSQTFSEEKYFESFLEELRETGIAFEVIRKEPYRLCGVRYDGIPRVTRDAAGL